MSYKFTRQDSLIKNGRLPSDITMYRTRADMRKIDHNQITLQEIHMHDDIISKVISNHSTDHSLCKMPGDWQLQGGHL